MIGPQDSSYLGAIEGHSTVGDTITLVVGLDCGDPIISHIGWDTAPIGEGRYRFLTLGSKVNGIPKLSGSDTELVSFESQGRGHDGDPGEHYLGSRIERKFGNGLIRVLSDDINGVDVVALLEKVGHKVGQDFSIVKV